jgi:hypothetical protein
MDRIDNDDDDRSCHSIVDEYSCADHNDDDDCMILII